MSQYFESDGVVLWNPATARAQRFLEDLRALEMAAGTSSGIGRMEADECQIDLRALDRFARILATSTLHETCGEAVLTVLALAIRADATDSWPPPLNKVESELLAAAQSQLASMPR